ncbi:hypothetical protein BJV74DRAFT_836416 [Russula compacta]|nr:hypothetical protein BJV74DRAFT_836416 [Russula compacta]
MPPLDRARKASDAPPATIRKQPHGLAHPDSGSNMFSIARKSAHSGVLQRGTHTAPDSTRARNTQSAPRPFITSQGYEIAGVAGFHRGAKPPVTGSSRVRVERRIKPVPHKNVGESRIAHGLKMARDAGRLLDGTAAKSLARRTKAITQVTSSRKRDLLSNQHRNQVDSAVYANIVFRRTSSNELAVQSSSDEEKSTLKSIDDGTLRRAPGPAVAGDNDAAWKTMMAAFGALSLSTATAAKKRRLPFLRRIVRTNFLRRCQVMGLAVDSISLQTQSLTILYKMPLDVSDNESDNELTEYAVHEVKVAIDQLVCPLCDTLGRLTTKEILEAHLEWDHPEVEASWLKRENGTWELALELPRDEVLVDEWEEAESPRSSPLDPSVHPWSPVRASPISEKGPGELQTPARETSTSMDDPPPAFFKFEPEFSPTPSSRTASLVPDTVRVHQAPSRRDPLGPLGVYPFLPSSVDDGNDNLSFSCRPCGPRLFDIVARHPMSEYGLTSWSLLERDEELFEIDDIRDEEKAMQALWNRWIFFNRRRYLLDPRKMVVEFVESSQHTIMETAGWKGVRVWLLLLAKHKYLTGDDVVTVMSHYEKLTGTEP